MSYSDLIPFATPRQLDYIEAIERTGGVYQASRQLKVGHRVIQRSIASLKKRAALQGHSPAHDMTKTVPDGFTVKGVSTYYGEDGKPRGQWVKSAVDESARFSVMQEAVASLADDVRGLSKPIPKPKRTHDDLLAVYPLGDPHFGLYVWGKECGDSFDLAEARRLTIGAVDRLVEAAPPAHTALILPLGDVFHADDQSNQTPAHKHQLDVDSRYVHVLKVGIETFRHAIYRALQKHERVIVRFVSGNHDPHAVWALAFSIAAYFDNEPRVEVDLSPAKHWFYRFGKVLLGASHGDTTKPEQLLGVMACDRAEDWGQTQHRYWYCGHVHHSSVKELSGVTVETFRTLAAADAYAMGHGYRAGRDMRCIVHHRQFGEIERHRCDVAMIE